MRTLPPLTYPTFARELLQARASLGVADEVGLALRAHRRALRMGQRTYARYRGWSKGHLSRLEAGAGSLRLADVLAALDGTGYALAMCRAENPDGDGPPTVPPQTAVASPSAPTPDGDGPPTVPPPAAVRSASAPAPDGASASPAHLDAPSPVEPGADTRTGPTLRPVRPEDWPRTELLARVRDGSRRFPAHHDTRQITSPPLWWWWSEATSSRSVEPLWYSRPPHPWDDWDDVEDIGA